MGHKTSGNIKSVVDTGRKFAIRLAEGPESDPPPFKIPSVSFSHAGLGGLALWDDEASEYRRILKQLVDLRSVIIGEREIARAFETAIVVTIDPNNLQAGKSTPERAKQAFLQLERDLSRACSEWTCVIPILGLTPPQGQWSIGNVKIVSTSSKAWQKIIAQVNWITSTGKDPPESRQLLVDHVRSHLIEAHHGQAFALVSVQAVESNAAWAAARRRLRFVLDCLNFAVSVIHGDSSLYGLSDRQKTRGFRTGIVLNTSDGSSFTLPNEKAEDPFPMNAEEFRTAISRQPGLNRLLQYLSLSNPSGHQVRVLSSIQWAGRAIAETRSEEAFLHNAIALESLILGGRTDVEITNRLSLSVVHLLGKWLVSRQKSVTEIKELYKVRSKIVHSGSYEVQSDSLAKLHAYVKTCLARLLTSRPFTHMSTEQDLDEWFQKKLRGD